MAARPRFEPTSLAGDLRESVLHGNAWSSSACNGRPAKLLKLQSYISAYRTENHGVGGSIPPLGTKISKGLRPLPLTRAAVQGQHRVLRNATVATQASLQRSRLLLGPAPIAWWGASILRSPANERRRGSRHDEGITSTARPSLRRFLVKSRRTCRRQSFHRSAWRCSKQRQGPSGI